jgi:hypothetical protein
MEFYTDKHSSGSVVRQIQEQIKVTAANIQFPAGNEIRSRQYDVEWGPVAQMPR